MWVLLDMGASGQREDPGNPLLINSMEPLAWQWQHIEPLPGIQEKPIRPSPKSPPRQKATSSSKATKPSNPRITTSSQRPDGETDSTTIVLDSDFDDRNYVAEKDSKDEGEDKTSFESTAPKTDGKQICQSLKASKSKAFETGKAQKVFKKQVCNFLSEFNPYLKAANNQSELQNA
ncbi:hypothetical protein DFH28DRAFT_1151850 [Melampsora americana]|nr:hypothetical protein DFH28DRAFT_1151850 [Melampsora americana]